MSIAIEALAAPPLSMTTRRVVVHISPSAAPLVRLVALLALPAAFHDLGHLRTNMQERETTITSTRHRRQAFLGRMSASANAQVATNDSTTPTDLVVGLFPGQACLEQLGPRNVAEKTQAGQKRIRPSSLSG